MFVNKQKGISNKYLSEGRDLNYYLDLVGDFKTSFDEFKTISSKGFNVIDESQSCSVGYKARAGEFLIKKLKEDGVRELVYVQPRRGFAGISLAYLCEKYDINLTLIMPSSKEVSDHQALCIELGAKPLFMRVAAMPNANSMAKKYAKATGAYYVPLGLDHEYVVACGIKLIYDFFKDREKPKKMWTVISTGVLSRSLQIALPDTEFVNVAVSRNIQDGELGRAEFLTYHKPFNSKSDTIPEEFDCENAYDAKGWDYMLKHGNTGDWFFNVAGNADEPKIDKSTIDSYRDWRDYRDFKNIL